MQAGGRGATGGSTVGRGAGDGNGGAVVIGIGVMGVISVMVDR